jgi:hypothetical protein
LACPFFVPLAIVNDGSWPHPSRLPLGAGWTGNCRASGQELAASDNHLREFCNLGYATACPRLPQPRDWDAVRFSVARANPNQVTLRYVCELDHTPIEHGELTFDLPHQVWLNPHADARVQRLASCYLEAYRARAPEEASRSARSSPLALKRDTFPTTDGTTEVVPFPRICMNR